MFVFRLKQSRQVRLAKKFVLRHLEEHPLPGDTLAGIARSWLEQSRIEFAVEAVANALAELIKEQKIERREVGLEILFIKKHMDRRASVPYRGLDNERKGMKGGM